MAQSDRFHEIEIKLRVTDLRAIQARLKRLRARKVSPRTHEFNTLYDTPTQDLRRRSELARIRIEHPATGSIKKQARGTDHAILTYKAPVRLPRTKASSRSRFKVNEEAEVSLFGAGAMDRILRGLGLSPQFRYEKYRTTYRLPGIPDLKIELDETPIGAFLELEGSPSSIDRAASRLGYATSEYIKETYGGLYLADCRRSGRKPGDMLFLKTKKIKKLRKYSLFS
jgi:adenylate cyclase, class 2